MNEWMRRKAGGEKWKWKLPCFSFFEFLEFIFMHRNLEKMKMEKIIYNFIVHMFSPQIFCILMSPFFGSNLP